MFGITLSARVPTVWQLSSVPHPLDLSPCTFNTRVQHKVVDHTAANVGWRQCGLHLPSHRDLLMTVPLCNQHLQHQRHLHLNQKPTVV